MNAQEDIRRILDMVAEVAPTPPPSLMEDLPHIKQQQVAPRYASLSDILVYEENLADDGVGVLRESLKTIDNAFELKEWNTLADWNSIPGHVHNLLEQAYPNMNSFAADLSGGYATNMTVSHNAGAGELDFVIENVSPIRKIWRTYSYLDNELLLENFVVEEFKHGRGYGKQVLSGLHRIAEKLGAKRMLLKAGGKSGPYAWAKAGFLPLYWNKVQENLQRELGVQRFADPVGSKFRRLTEGGREGIWDIAYDTSKIKRFNRELSPGRVLLEQLADGYFAEFVLADANQTNKLRQFLAI